MISVIINTYNSINALKWTLNQNIKILNQNQINDIILVDDDSDDNTVEYVETHFPKIRIIQNEETLYAARSLNRGASIANHNIILFIPPNTLIESIDIQTIQNEFNQPNIFSIIPSIQLVTKKGKRYNTSYSRPRFKSGFLQCFPLTNKNINQNNPIFGISRQIMFVSKDIFFELEGFDPLYGASQDHILDLFYTAYKRNFKTTLLPNQKVSISHFKANQYPIEMLYKEYIAPRNKYLFTWKNNSHIWIWCYHILMIILNFLTFQINESRAFIRAIIKLPNLILSRRLINIKPQKTDFEVINSW
ncbi:hypothetical protein DID75_05390 [Candidatus Marinamargulisbacteria bacterium SCGC AG-410-N11]|nr:hypothetical protein DID75_05390 [Candidatus Marinamargulisbacteria bacterium SCGC AG-410-N11]